MSISSGNLSSVRSCAPKVTLNPDVHDFYAFTTDDLIVEGYEHGPQVKNIPIAV